MKKEISRKKVNKQISQKLKFAVFIRDKFTCQYCGRCSPEVILEIDHIKSKKNDGSNNFENLITSCLDCNRGKGSKNINGLKRQTQSKHGLIGKFFHSFDEKGEIEWQGLVLDEIDGNAYLIQLFSWWDGYPTDQFLIPKKKVINWRFYDGDDEMDRAYCRKKGIDEEWSLRVRNLFKQVECGEIREIKKERRR